MESVCLMSACVTNFHSPGICKVWRRPPQKANGIPHHHLLLILALPHCAISPLPQHGWRNLWIAPYQSFIFSGKKFMKAKIQKSTVVKQEKPKVQIKAVGKGSNAWQCELCDKIFSLNFQRSFWIKQAQFQKVILQQYPWKDVLPRRSEYKRF